MGGALSASKHIYDENQKQTKQTTMDILLKRVTVPHTEPPEGPSGSIPGEGIVIIGGGSSMHVLAPEDLPVGRGRGSDIDAPDPGC